jgi:large subunit ribosomal protein L5
MSNTTRLKDRYQAEIAPALMAKFGYKSIMEVPKLTKICINQGMGAAVADKKIIDTAIEELSIITGQRAVSTKSRLAISNFKLRENMPIGVRVTLRRETMFEFMDRLVSISLPRVRDFRGINAKGFDGRGNYTFGITEQIIFPEINIDRISRINGMDITFVTTAKTDEEAMALLTEMGMPFKTNK